MRDYRVPLFRLLAESHDLAIFTPSAQNEPPPDLGPNVEISYYVSGKRPLCYYLRDFLIIFRNIFLCDVFITSFVASLYSIIGLLFSFLLKKRTIVWSERSLACKRKLWLEKWFLRRVDAFFVMGEPQRALLIYCGVSPHRIFKANEYPGVNYSELQPAPIYSLNSERKRVVLYLGRFIPIKGIQYLLEAYRIIEERHDDVLLIVAGDGELRDDLKAQARSLGIRKIEFPGYIHDPREIKFLFDQGYMLVVPSIISKEKKGCEGGPIVVLEALSAGLPVLGTDGLISSVQFIKNGINGFIVPHSNSRALAEKMETMLGWKNRSAIRTNVLESFSKIRGFDFQIEVLNQAIQFVLSNR